MRRRDLLAGVLAPAATPAVARAATPLHGELCDVLSPPFLDGNGRGLTLADLRGQVALANIWAIYCAPYREEMTTTNLIDPARRERGSLTGPAERHSPDTVSQNQPTIPYRSS